MTWEMLLDGMLFLAGAASGVALGIAGIAYLAGREPPAPPEPTPPPTPLCHHCAAPLRPVLARQLPFEDKEDGKAVVVAGSPEAAAWFCSRHDVIIYYAEPPGAKPRPIEEV